MDIIKEVENHVKTKYDHDEYNWVHIQFVVKNALILGEKLNADLEIIHIAALFHDIDYSRGRKQHTADSAKYASKFLNNLNFPKDKIIKIEKAIMCHTSAVLKTIKNPTIEGKILFDADKMWTMTPKGFSRTIAHTYQKNKSYDLIYKKLEKAIKKYENLHFDESREIIKHQREICINFIKELKNENNNFN